jgi:murein DD-endopeptidase MepM/ murein hydrolase activator NlpD
MTACRPGAPLALVLAAALACLAAPAHGRAENAPLSLRPTPERVKQGGIATLRIDGGAPAERLRLRLGNREILLGSRHEPGPRVARIGVDLEQPPGPLELILEWTTGAGRAGRAQAVVHVTDAAYPVQRLTVPRTFTELDAATLDRIAREKARLDRLWEAASPTPLWRAPFRLPLENASRGTGFGLRRIVNGEPRGPHTGVDFPAPAGTPVLAANAGLVAVAEEHFFAGKSVVLDHGEGLYTMYFHLEESLVRPGQQVAQGAVIGRVGSTGRATGPHLHWGVRLYGARVDPEEVLRVKPE